MNSTTNSQFKNLNSQNTKVSDYDKLSSLMIAGSLVEHLVERVSQIKYMEELENKLKPYVICDTTEQALQAICAGELKYDERIDDHLLSDE